MSFGAFMDGLQGGVKAGQSARRERQLDDIYDAARRKIGNEEAADEMGRKSRNLPAGDTTSLGDPLGQRIWSWAEGLFKGGDDAATAVPDPGAAALQDKVSDVETLRTGIPQSQPYEGEGLIPYADGGKPDDEERKKEQARAQRYGATAEQAIPAVGNVAGKTMAAGPKAARSAMHGIADVVDKGTDDPIDPGMLGSVGQAVEGAFDYPRVAIASGLRAVGDKVGGWGEPGAPKQAVPTAAPAQPTAKRPTTGTPPGGRDRSSGQRASASAAIPTPGAAPAAPAAPQQGLSEDVIKRIPWDKVNPMDLPKFKTQDWVKYREDAIDQMVMRGGGITVMDAMDKVDQQVIGMQQRGTKALLQEAIMRVQSGDMKGAGNALVQMFQYVPSGTDAVVGTYNGQLVAQFIDEQTGQPVGDPTPVNAQMLGDLWQQYGNPAEWAKMAQDRAQLADTQKRTGLLGRAQDLAEKRYTNIELPVAQSEVDYRAVAGQAAMAKAVGGGGAEGLKPSEQLASDKDVRDVISQYAMAVNPDGKPLNPKLQDPNIQSALLAAIMKMKRQTGRPTEDILIEILSAAKE